jgi:hypothetical protein
VEAVGGVRGYDRQRRGPNMSKRDEHTGRKQGANEAVRNSAKALRWGEGRCCRRQNIETRFYYVHVYHLWLLAGGGTLLPFPPPLAIRVMSNAAAAANPTISANPIILYSVSLRGGTGLATENENE